MNQSDLETSTPPEWLVKLEERREKNLTRAKLGHESGAGAPCSDCGDKCPGLDLHFWRKVCRNCKCRKDQHMCQDDDSSGWAQFEILGQIRSKPAYIKIKALADQPVKLDWIPPNSAPDIVSDYMDKLGSNKIPVAGSDAAVKRKQQLEFQVPPHDLDPTFCDNLTESETAQLEQYVKKIRENCVGQGNVIRVGDVKHGQINNSKIDPKLSQQMEVLEKLNETPSQIFNDKVAMNLLSSDKLSKALLLESAIPIKTHLLAFSRPLSPMNFPGDNFQPKLSFEIRDKLEKLPINVYTAESLTKNGPFYDKIIENLESKNWDISKDPVLQPIKDFRKEYIKSPTFRNEIDEFIKLDKQYSTPIKSNKLSNVDSFNSPVPLKNPIQTKVGSLMKQDTPMRKVTFGGVNAIYDLGFPADVKIEKDRILSNIVHSKELFNSLQNHLRPDCKNLIISRTPLNPDFTINESKILSPYSKYKLDNLGLNQDHILSGFVNGPYYDKILDSIKNKGIDFSNCKILQPMEQFRQELQSDLPFQNEIKNYVDHIPNSHFIAISDNVPFQEPNSMSVISDQNSTRNMLPGSKSSDSGFESKPPTPNYSTFPMAMLEHTHQQPEVSTNPFANATLGKYASIPGIDELNMYPHVAMEQNKLNEIDNDMGFLNMNSPEQNIPQELNHIPVLKCKDCQNFIMSGEVAVKAERAGKEIAWHPECFKCHSCRELLADLVYFFHSGNVYCGRDLAIILKIPRCNACDELIFTKEYTAAENATFHIKHFCCYQCDIPLAGKQYIPDEKTNMPLCLECYDQYYAEKCKTCMQVIGPTEQGVSWGKVHWHGKCFSCAGIDCGKSLIGGRFCVKQDMPFCSPQCVRSVLN